MLACIAGTSCASRVGSSFVCDAGSQTIAGKQCLLPNGCDKFSCCEPRIVGNSPPTNYDAKGYCWKTLRIQVTHGDACSLDHTFTLNNVGIYCSLMYGAAPTDLDLIWVLKA
jgi:hypothetical protein